MCGCRWLAVLAVPLAVAEATCLSSTAHSAVADGDLKQVEYKGSMHQFPLARGRWMSTQVPHHVVSILLREKLGIQVTESFGSSSTDLLRQVSGCSDSSLLCSEQEQAAGMLQEPPAMWAATEVWMSTVENRRLRQFVSSASFTGYISDPGLRALPPAFARAKDAGIHLGFWELLLLPETRSCCFSDMAEVQAAAAQIGVTSQVAPGGKARATMEALGHDSHIQDGWYIASSCRANLSACIPVVLGEFNWNMPEWINVAETNSLPLAITPYGWVRGAMTAIPALAARNLSFLFYWWRPDSTFESLSPEMVIFREKMLTIKQSQPLEKIIWKKILEVDRGSDIMSVLSRATFSNELMDQFVTKQLNESAEDIACTWLLDNEATWGTWIPDSTNCEKGFFYDNATLQCMGCAPGKFAPSKGSTACMECVGGEFQSQLGKTDCEPCLTGAFSERSAASCTSCAPGRWQNETGQRQCRPCDEGDQLTTRWPGSTSESECACPKGTYRPLGPARGALCEACPAGMDCMLGSDLKNTMRGPGPFPQDQPPFPQLLAGYMSLAAEPTRVFKCLPELNCPGGGTASCASRRAAEQPACGECEDDTYSSSGRCHECGAVDVTPFIVIIFGVVCALGLLTWVVNRNLLLQSNTTVMSVVMLGLLFSGIQAMGVFKQMSIEWSGAVLSVLDFVNLLSFDFQILQTGCVLGTNNPVNSFVMRQFVAPGSALVIFFALCLKKTWAPGTNVKVELVNTVGTVLNILFISIIASAVAPLICYRHPSKQDWSMVSASSVLCNAGGRHGKMLVAGILALLLIPLPFLCSACYFIRNYPKYLADSKNISSQHTLQAMRFLFFRFWPHRYYYSIVLLCRSLAICFVPVVIKDDVALQICIMAFLLCFTTLLQQDLRPWRHQVANWMDGVLSVMLVLLLLSGALAANLEAKPVTVEIVGLSAILFIFAGAGGTIMFGVFGRLLSRSKYGFFICHHKADAAAQARLLKMKLQSKTHARIFIDSDNLTELDNLFDIVKTKVAHLVVYLTRDTLRRAWCAGEIATAFQKVNMRVTAVRTAPFLLPTEDELASIDDFLDLTSCTLEEYGISFDNVREAYRRLFSIETPQLRLEKEGGVHNLVLLVDHLRKPASRNTDTEVVCLTLSLPGLPEDLDDGVLISADAGDMEAMAAATFLNAKIQEQVLSATDRGTWLFHEYMQAEPAVYGRLAETALATMVVLSNSSMSSKSQVCAIIGAMSVNKMDGPTAQKIMVVPVYIEGFKFPDDRYYNEDLPRLLPALADEARILIQAFFKKIAMPFSVGASEVVLDIQSKQIGLRALRAAVGRSSSCKPGGKTGSLSKVQCAGTFDFSQQQPKAGAKPTPELMDEDWSDIPSHPALAVPPSQFQAHRFQPQ